MSFLYLKSESEFHGAQSLFLIVIYSVAWLFIEYDVARGILNFQCKTWESPCYVIFCKQSGHYTSDSKHFISRFYEKRLEIGQCYSVWHSLQFWMLLVYYEYVLSKKKSVLKWSTNHFFISSFHLNQTAFLEPEAYRPQRSHECTAMMAIFSQNTVNVACKKN